MRHISGQCHCGNISYHLDWPGDGARIPVRACGCDYCMKHGAVWTSRPDARLTIALARPAAVNRYQFGTRTADFHVCATCGILTLALCTIDGGLYAVVNANTFENIEPHEFEQSHTDFGGEDVDTRLARRRRNWMPARLG